MILSPLQSPLRAPIRSPLARAVSRLPGTFYVVSITGTPAVGEVLTATASGSGGTGFSYRWTRNGSNISGATSSTYTVDAADAGAVLQVLVTYTVVATGLPETAASNLVAIPAAGSRFLLESSGALLLESGDYLLLEA